MTTYAHLARLARFVRYALLAILAALEIFLGQDEPLGFASLASVARVMDDILTPIQIELRVLEK